MTTHGGPYCVQTNGSGRSRIIVPKHVATKLPEGALFVPELTDEGILYKLVGVVNDTTPAWAHDTEEQA